MTGFQQAVLAVQKEQEFEQLKQAILLALAPDTAEAFLDRLKSAGLRIRDLEAVLTKGIPEKVSRIKISTAKLYEALPVSDQAQIREFYLSKIEEVDPERRTRFQKLYRYY